MAEKALTAVIQEACIQDISTRSVDDPVKAMSMTGISKRQASRLCEKIADGAEHRSRTSQHVRHISPARSLGGSRQSSPKSLAGLKRTSLGRWRARRDSNS